MIRHVLKDGSRVESIKGIVIKADHFPQVYRVIERIEERYTDGVIQTPERGS